MNPADKAEMLTMPGGLSGRKDDNVLEDESIDPILRERPGADRITSIPPADSLSLPLFPSSTTALPGPASGIMPIIVPAPIQPRPGLPVLKKGYAYVTEREVLPSEEESGVEEGGRGKRKRKESRRAVLSREMGVGG